MKIALVIEREDDSYLPFIKPLFAGHQVTVIQRHVNTTAELYSAFDGIITTREDLLRRLTFRDGHISIDNYAGSLFTKGDKPFLVLNPLRDLVSTPAGLFLAKRYIKKIISPTSWFPQSEFTWELVREDTADALYNRFLSADLIAVDIETTRGDPYVIKCVGYCGVWFNSDGSFTTHSIVIPFTSMFFVEWIRKFNLLMQPKIFQNGLFDNLYFFRFGSPVNNWLLDTLEMFHCLYAELPKDLAYITFFLLRDTYYWKDEADSGDLEDLYKYNAKDCWATANSMLALLDEIPDYAIANYKEKFGLVFPCISANFEGIRYDAGKVDPEDPASLFSIQSKIVENNLGSLQRKLGKPHFKPNSHKQVGQLLKVLTGKDFGGTDKKILGKVAKLHPFNNFLIDEILKYRKAKKLVSTYLGAELWHGRLLYNHRPSGTDTLRMACTQSLFSGKGAQIQNIPDYVKQVMCADEGFYLGEADNEQSEARCLAYLSGDQNLIDTVESGRDFHSVNIERFFGVAYDDVWDSLTNKTKNKHLRDLSKRVNHGTAYVMGPDMLLETMGLENVVKAQILLGLPADWKPVKVCQYLLDRYHLAYPKVKADFYEWVKAYIGLHGKLVSALGWTRYCFGDPKKNKRHWKSYIAHVPQNLSVGIINRGFIKVFNEVQRPNWKDFRQKAQIHDSDLFQYRIGRLDLALAARQAIEITVKVTDVKGIVRDMRIPVALKGEATHWSNLKPIHV